MFQEQVSQLREALKRSDICGYRDSTQAKQVQAIFDQIYKKHSKKMSVLSQSCTLLPDHLLPMIQVQERSTGDIVC